MSSYFESAETLILKLCNFNEKKLVVYLDHLLCNATNKYTKRAEKFIDEDLCYVVYEPVKDANNVCLVAHADTIGNIDSNLLLYKCISTTNNHIYTHNTTGIFDDRIGILGILGLVNIGYNPYIIITGCEEIGCMGAIELIENYSELDLLFPNNNIQCLIELDRHGKKEVVFYDLEYPEFEKIFTRYFSKEQGIWSDISMLAPYWNIAAANLSVGYYKEHTPKEYFVLEDLYSTLDELIKIIKGFNDYKREDRWKYKGNKQTFSFLLGNNVNFKYNCISEIDTVN